jgi:hypothetical protein
MSFRITEDYVQAALELVEAGYLWAPAPGDWMLDRDDHSIGMLTVPVSKPDLVRRLNAHLPTYVQASELLNARGVREIGDGTFLRPDGSALIAFSAEQWRADPAVCRLKALAAAIRESSGNAQ